MGCTSMLHHVTSRTSVSLHVLLTLVVRHVVLSANQQWIFVAQYFVPVCTADTNHMLKIIIIKYCTYIYTRTRKFHVVKVDIALNLRS